MSDQRKQIKAKTVIKQEGWRDREVKNITGLPARILPKRRLQQHFTPRYITYQPYLLPVVKWCKTPARHSVTKLTLYTQDMGIYI